MIPSELPQGMKQTERHMEQAETNLKEQNIRKSIESENLALKGLKETRDLLTQMKNSNRGNQASKTTKPQKTWNRQQPRFSTRGRHKNAKRTRTTTR